MKIYVASKFENKELVKEVQEELIREGHSITHDWSNESDAGKTGIELENYQARCAQQDFDGVKNADLVLLINHQGCKGTYTEFGIALALNKYVVIVKPELTNQVFFHLKHPHKIFWAKSIADAYDIIDDINFHEPVHTQLEFKF